MPEYMTEAEAWREIAERLCCTPVLYSGLCSAISRLCREDLVHEDTAIAMFDRVSDAHGDLNEAMMCGRVTDAERRACGFGFVYVYQPYDAQPRVLAALWFALEAEAAAEAEDQ